MKNKKELIAFCGLYCGECPNHTGKIADFARDLRKELRSVRFDKTAEVPPDVGARSPGRSDRRNPALRSRALVKIL